MNWPELSRKEVGIESNPLLKAGDLHTIVVKWLPILFLKASSDGAPTTPESKPFLWLILLTVRKFLHRSRGEILLEAPFPFLFPQIGMCVCVCVRERERQRGERETERKKGRGETECKRERNREEERKRKRETQRDREGERQRERGRGRERGREGDRERECKRERERQRGREEEEERDTDRETERERDVDGEREGKKDRERKTDEERESKRERQRGREEVEREGGRERERGERMNENRRGQANNGWIVYPTPKNHRMLWSRTCRQQRVIWLKSVFSFKGVACSNRCLASESPNLFLEQGSEGEPPMTDGLNPSLCLNPSPGREKHYLSVCNWLTTELPFTSGYFSYYSAGIHFPVIILKGEKRSWLLSVRCPFRTLSGGIVTLLTLFKGKMFLDLPFSPDWTLITLELSKV
ncbi:RNA-binding protein 25, partial [Ophiophagus hannah]